MSASRVNKNFQSINDKNRHLREQILVVRKKINIERENLVKSTIALNNKSSELIKNNGKLYLT